MNESSFSQKPWEPVNKVENNFFKVEFVGMGTGSSSKFRNNHSNKISNVQPRRNLISTLKSKKLDQPFISNIKTLLNTFNAQQISINSMTNVYLNNINKKISNKYIIPIEITALVNDYVGSSMDNLPILSEENIFKNKCNINAIYVGATSFNSDCNINGRIIGNMTVSSSLSCTKNLIILDIAGYLSMNWCQLFCAQGGNIFIRCNELILDNISRIRTINKWIEMPTNRYDETESINDETNFGSVVLIVKNRLQLTKSSIYTGFLYIECGSLKVDSPSRIVSRHYKPIIYVNGEKCNDKHFQ